MKRIGISAIVLILLAGIAGILWLTDYLQRNNTIPSLQEVSKKQQPKDIPRLTTIAQNLEVPWEIAFLPDSTMLVTERPGQVLHIDPQTGNATTVATLSVKQIGEGGLHGITLHPNFKENNYVYVYYTYAGDTNQTLNRVSRFLYTNNTLHDETTIVDAIPGAANHDGGRIKFGPDNHLYITTGDAQQPSLAQNTDSLAGKILRVTDTGTAVNTNPFDNEVYSYGHRNPQGICWDDNDQLLATEHGPSGAQSGFDELNLIRPGVNYGWPEIQGDETQNGMQTPLIQSGTSTWAPAGAACIGEKVYFGGLRGNALYEATINGDAVELTSHLQGELGRIRAVVLGSDGMLYITTSNRDGRGVPDNNDDRIIRVNPEKL